MLSDDPANVSRTLDETSFYYHLRHIGRHHHYPKKNLVGQAGKLNLVFYEQSIF